MIFGDLIATAVVLAGLAFVLMLAAGIIHADLWPALLPAGFWPCYGLAWLARISRAVWGA
jgi:hypothetical protein